MHHQCIRAARWREGRNVTAASSASGMAVLPKTIFCNQSEDPVHVVVKSVTCLNLPTLTGRPTTKH